MIVSRRGGFGVVDFTGGADGLFNLAFLGAWFPVFDLAKRMRISRCGVYGVVDLLRALETTFGSVAIISIALGIRRATGTTGIAA
jgi:hypothetical protein